MPVQTQRNPRFSNTRIPVTSPFAMTAVIDGKQNLVEAFKVGALYINVTGVNPASELGYGTWTAFGAGRTLVGRAAGDPDFGTVEQQSGAKTVAAEGSNASEDAHTHSYGLLPHTHDIGVNTDLLEVTPGAASIQTSSGDVDEQRATASTGAGSSPTGAGSAHTHVFTGTATSVVQPSIVVYFWKRTS